MQSLKKEKSYFGTGTLQILIEVCEQLNFLIKYLMDIEHLTFSKGPKKVAPFSHAVRAGEFLFITGQMPTLKNDSTQLVQGGIEAQTHQVMKNLIEVLSAAGSSIDKVIFARVYLVNFGDFDKMNKVYASYFKTEKLPARTCIGVTGLAVGASVEIDLIASR